MPSDISLDDYDLLCRTAQEFNEYAPPERVRAAAPSASDAKGDRPGDEYNRRAAWAELLEPHGWRVDRTAGDVTYWTRPGKTRGTSATTGKCSTEGAGDLLYVFSGNAGPFDADHAYSKFAALTLLECGGDFAAAAKRLRGEGYGLGDPSIVFGPPAVPLAGGGPPDDGVKPDPDFATNEDLQKYDLGITWIWNLWFQRSTVNLLSAEGGAGKTRFMLDLCRRTHLGEPWPDGSPTVPWPHQYLAMWVAGDRNHGELLENSTKFGFGERISYSGSKTDPLGGITLNTREDFTTLYRRAKAARPMFLVVDTAGGATSYNLTRQEEARQFFAPLSDMALRLGLCVVVITHLNASKNTYGKRAEERVRTVVRITSQDREPETKRRVEVQKSNARFPDPIGMFLGESGCEYDADPPAAPVPFGQAAEPAEKGPPTKVKECAEWLAGRLADAPRPLVDLRREAESAGFKVGTLYTAKEHLKLVEARSNNLMYWGLKKNA